MKIISFKICPFVQRVTARLEAQNIPYEIEFISLSDKPDWFMEISPNGQVPVLVTDNGTALFESDAIVEYLDDILDPLEADITPEQRALDRAWNYQGSKQYLTQCSTMRSPDKETLVERTINLGKAFSKAEKEISEGPFFKGDQLSNIDVAWLPLLHRADIIRNHTGYDLLEGNPKVQAWQERLMKTGLAEKSVPEDFEKLFTEFYLSEKTYLGGRRVPVEENTECGASNGGCC
ncbi:glutathione S-transferase family protein [Curvivirga sp.]|uniref:glutathione S-transferase family protein n=1 Tax=Curvivirga sp. TaxID=2856848 RepID=UPI003B593D2C